MQITLYKNCILNDSYSEVFDCNHKAPNTDISYHEKYINNLNNEVLEIENTYLTLEGVLNIDISNEVYGDYDKWLSYNYMKIKDASTLITKYYFINHMEIINGTLMIYYKEDVWSNYSNKMDFRMGIMSNSKLLSYTKNTNNEQFIIPFYNLPLNFVSNNKIIIENCFSDTPLKNKKYGVILAVQKYRISTVEKETWRFQKYCRLVDKSNYANEYIFDSYFEALLGINALIVHSATHVIRDKNNHKDGEWGYEILESYVIPEEILNNQLTGGGTRYEILEKDTQKVQDYELTELLDQNIELQTKTIQGNIENFKKIAVGTINMPVDIFHNGTDINISVYCMISSFDISFYMNIQNKIIDITESFNILPPMTSNTLDTTQLNKIQKNIRNISLDNQKTQLDYNIAKKGLDIFGNFSGMMQGFASKDGAQVSDSGIGLIKSSLDVASGVVSIEEIENQRNLVNAEAYTSSKSIQVMNNKLLSSRYGICWYEVTPDNEQEVNNYINEIGYKINEVINYDIFKDFKVPENYDYNIIRFNYLRIAGSFPQDIMKKLKSILINGFKIWYNYGV